jgi:CheY-like chemotaxis protein
MLRTTAVEASTQRVLRSMQASARHGTDLVRQLMAFARGGAAERAELTLPPLVADVGELLAPALPRSIEATTECAPDLPAVLADGTQLKQILFNLCINARDAMPNGGNLKLTAAHATAAELGPHNATGPHVRLSVADTGTGMPPEVLTKIFEPFFTTKEAGKGTGLGLATVRNLVQKHDGVIAVESTVGVGTTFHIYLPVPPPRAPADPACRCEACAPSGHGELIVVVDDNEAMRTTLCSSLEQAGYRTHPLADGGAALEWFQLHRSEAAVTLVDLVMPGIDGSALLGVLPALDPVVRIVALRHTDDPPAPGTAHHLTKPVQPEALLQLVRRLIDGT